MPWLAALTLDSVKAPVDEFWNAPMATAMAGSPSPRKMYTLNGTRPAHRRSVRQRAGQDPPAPGAWVTPGAVVVSTAMDQPPTLAAHCCATIDSAADSWAWVGNCSSPAGATGSAALAAVFTVPSLIRAGSSIGRALPSSQRFWP